MLSEYNSNNELIAYDGVSYQYDNNGNMTGKTDQAGTTTYTYDADNRLVQLVTPNAQLVTYYYDPFGRRIKKQIIPSPLAGEGQGEGVTYYLYSDEGLIGEYDATGAEIKTYSYKSDSTWTTDPVFMKQSGEYYFYHNDHLGTPMIMTDISGNIVWSATYSSFGKADVQTSSTITNNLRFAGQYYDQETGLHYNYFRYYDPVTGRYVSTDPIGLQGGINLYAYVGNNAVNTVDPRGLAPEDRVKWAYKQLNENKRFWKGPWWYWKDYSVCNEFVAAAHKKGDPDALWFPTVLRNADSTKPFVENLADPNFARLYLDYLNIEDAQPGDIIVWYGGKSHHSAIYVGDGKVIYQNDNEGVKIETIKYVTKHLPTKVVPIVRRYKY